VPGAGGAADFCGAVAAGAGATGGACACGIAPVRGGWPGAGADGDGAGAGGPGADAPLALLADDAAEGIGGVCAVWGAELLPGLVFLAAALGGGGGVFSGLFADGARDAGKQKLAALVFHEINVHEVLEVA
jgi:hypothetical protein